MTFSEKELFKLHVIQFFYLANCKMAISFSWDFLISYHIYLLNIIISFFNSYICLRKTRKWHL